MKNGAFTTEQVAMEHGTDKCKEYFSKYKKLGGHKDSLYKTLDETYVEWETVKESRKTRKDGRINNGEGQLPYKEDIREAILSFLGNTEEIVVTYRHLLMKLGILDEVLYTASRKFSSVEQKEYYKNLDDVYKINGYAIFWDTVHLEYNRLKENLESALNDMAKKKIIKISNVTNVAYIGIPEHETLHVFEAKKIDDTKRVLREKYDVTLQELVFKPRAKEKQIKHYKMEETQYFHSLGIDYVYGAVAIYINATKKESDRYKAIELSKTIKQKHLQHAYELAVNRQNDYQNEHSNLLLEQFGGKAKPSYTLGDKPTKKEWIEFEKNNGTYASSYKEVLKRVNNVKIEEEDLMDVDVEEKLVDVEEELFSQAWYDDWSSQQNMKKIL